MPDTPGTSAQKTVDPALAYQNSDRTQLPTNPVASVTWDPNEGIEAGRTVPPTPTTVGGGGTDSL